MYPFSSWVERGNRDKVSCLRTHRGGTRTNDNRSLIATIVQATTPSIRVVIKHGVRFCRLLVVRLWAWLNSNRTNSHSRLLVMLHDHMTEQHHHGDYLIWKTNNMHVNQKLTLTDDKNAPHDCEKHFGYS